MSKKDSTPGTLTLMVAAEDDTLGDDDMIDEHRVYTPLLQGVESASVVGFLPFRRAAPKREGKTKDVELDKVKGRLYAIQGELETLLKDLPDLQESPFRLKEVEVGLSLNAEGHIGIATIGSEISLSLRFAR
ncbi:Pepco domain-containing protein [Mycobacterium parmense]|uniref:Uncharacterized protein n=1 Tax=Mycobacterium parmense TaxID=185642 RepID=A0A7I7YN69_9MYCO|nr:hypothetical protein [Mycobacterium parmense]MCV7348994.1 hypothetical protein [Mycobacterium parmense]BBZ43129.1 hypothetical protein MPRM_04100 [Mycobacterium parmense]